jgi:hypothetical protein
LWVVFLWFLDFLDFALVAFILPTFFSICIILSFAFTLVLDLFLIPFQEV